MRPAQLVLSSPSEGALNTKAHEEPESMVLVEDEGEIVEERGVQSDVSHSRAFKDDFC